MVNFLLKIIYSLTFSSYVYVTLYNKIYIKKVYANFFTGKEFIVHKGFRYDLDEIKFTLLNKD